MTKNKKTCTQQAVCCNAGRMPAESPVGFSSVHARANIRVAPHYSKPPAVRGVITFNSPTSDIEEIELLDKTNSPTEIARAMREAGDFLINYKPTGDE